MSGEKSDLKPPGEDPWRANEEARRRQLREDGRRSLAVNLDEGLALSEFLLALPEKERPADHEALEVFRAAQRTTRNEN